jgi:hypothetical protein
MILDRCQRCKRPGRAYCEQLGRPCLTLKERQSPPRFQRRHLGVPVSKDRKAYYREYDQRIRRESGWFKDSTFDSTSVAPLAANFAPNEITA